MGPAAAPAGAITAALREAIPRALAAVARRWGDFHDAEDAVQDAALSATAAWARDGLPDRPVAWLVAAAMRRHVDAIRADAARRDREVRWAVLQPVDQQPIDHDDTLAVFLMCCHPALDRGAQIALTLRAVGGLTTREIARGLMLRESTVAQRISRAKAAIRRAGGGFAPPTDEAQRDARVRAVIEVLSLIHTESHSATLGDAIVRPALAAEALRLARELLRQTPERAPWRGEVLGLIALMLMTNAREPARIDARGMLVPLAAQNRSLWRAELIAEGELLLREALSRHPIGPSSLRAAIAAAHSTAPSAAATDWREIVALYDLLRACAPGPVTELARLVAWAEVHGPEAALRDLDRIGGAPPVRIAAVRAHLLERAGRDPSAAMREAAAAATNQAERRWFDARLAAITITPARRGVPSGSEGAPPVG